MFLKDCQGGNYYGIIQFMTATGHALIGAIIAAKITNPYVAIPLAIASHVAADIFPHWDSGTNSKGKKQARRITEAVVDVVVGFIAAFIILSTLFPQTSLSYAFILIIASQLLDWVTAPYCFLNVKVQPFIWLSKFQSRFHTRLDIPWGIITQVSIIFVLLFLAKLF